jgi:hypothetical protein
MSIITPQYVYLLDEDLYRLGNATSSRLDNVRSVDVNTFQQNGILMVRANGKGISVGTKEYLEKLQLSGWLWKIPTTTTIPADLLLNPDPDPTKQGHFFLCPNSDMTMDRYRALLSELALRCERTQKL